MKSTRDIQISLSLDEQNAKKNAELEEQIAADRNKDFQDLQRELDDLHSAMTDIQVHVLDQATKVDAIEDKTDKAAENTKKALISLDEARSNQERRRKRIATIVIVLLSIGLVIGGGVLISAALGMSGTVGFLVGAGIMIAGMAVLAGIGYGIYSLLKLCMRKPAKEEHIVEHRRDTKDHKKQRPSHKSEMTNELSEDNTNDQENPSLLTRGVSAAISTGVAKHALFALPKLAASTIVSEQHVSYSLK